MRNYEMFLRDYVEENDPETFELLGEADEVVDEELDGNPGGKSGVYKENYYIKKKFQLPIVGTSLSKRRNRDMIVDAVGRFMDVNVSRLTTSGPVFTFTYGEKDVKFLYDMMGIDGSYLQNLFDEMVNETYYGSISKFFSGFIKHSPQKMLFTALACDAIQNGYDDVLECVEYMYAFTEYPILYREYWHLGVKQDVMDYTIEHMSSKYKIRQFKNLQELLKYDTTNAVEFYKETLKKGPDNIYVDLMWSIRSRINSKLRNISNLYYKNIEKNATQHNNVTTFDDGEIADQEGNLSAMNNIISRTIERFSTGEINKAMVRIAADRNKIDKGNLEGMIGQIMSTKQNRTDKFIDDVVTLYFMKYRDATDISSVKFLNYGIALYRSIGTSKDETMSDLKQIIRYWMYDIINIRSMYQREATVIAYTRGVFDYMILQINYYN